MKQRRRVVLASVGVGLAAVLAVFGITSTRTAVSAVPTTPTGCEATQSGSSFTISWTPVTANPPVNWYSVRFKGSTTTQKADPADTSWTWQGAVPAGADTPLAMRVAAHSRQGLSGFCTDEVGDDSEPTESPSPTETPTETPTDPPGQVDTDEVGIRVFPQYSGATYGNHAQVLADLDRLGVQRISGLLTPGMSADEVEFYQDANALGIKVWFAVGKPGVVLSDSQWTQVRNLLSGPLNGVVEAASGWNEPNHQVGGDWSTPTAAHQKKLWVNVQQVNAATGQSILVGTPPLWSGNINEQYADLDVLAPKIQGAYDLINWHQYPHGNTGSDLEAFIDRQVTEFRQAYGTGYPLLNSESGYSTSVNSSAGNPVTEAEQAELIDDLILLHQERDIWVSYFEFLNDPDASLSNREAHFGLIYTPTTSPSTWRDKPAFAVFQGLVS